MGTLALVLSGCVKIDDTPYEVDCNKFPTHPDCITDDNTTTGEAPGLVKVLDTIPTDDPITITFWHVYGQSKGELLNSMISDFEDMMLADYGVTVVVDSVSQGDYTSIRTNTLNAITAGTTPNLVVGYPDHVAGYLKGNAVIPLDDFIYSDKWGVDLTDFIQSYLDENQQYAGGYMYSFPYSKSTEMMVYNKSVIDANKTAIETALGEPFPTDRPLTWAELDELADILVAPTWDPDNPTANKCQYLINFDSPANFFINSVRQWQGGYTNSNGDILVDNANTKLMLNYISQRFLDRTFAVPVAWNESYGSNNFIAGDVCMSVGSTAGINYNIPPDGSFEVGVLPTPQYDVNNESAVQQGPNIAIMSNSSDAQRLVSWLLIKYLTDADNTAAWAMETGYLPVRYSGYNSTEYQSFLDITDNSDSLYYSSQAANAAKLQTEYFNYDPAFAGAVTSSDARARAEEAMNSLFAGFTAQDVIDDMLSQLGS